MVIIIGYGADVMEKWIAKMVPFIIIIFAFFYVRISWFVLHKKKTHCFSAWQSSGTESSWVIATVTTEQTTTML